MKYPPAQLHIETIVEIANAYLLKDILAFDRVKSSRLLLDLLKLLAFQVGQEISLNEIATQFNALDQRNDIGQLWENFILQIRVSSSQFLQFPRLPEFPYNSSR